MKTKVTLKKISGFTLIELMITIAIIAILVTMATPASFFQQTTAVNYATRATQHAKIFSSYINDNYTSIYNNAKISSPQSITASTVANYTGGISMVDNYGAIPCATVRYNSTSKKLEIYMYYSGGSGIISSVLASANNYLSGISGQLIGSNYVGAFGTWTTAASSITSATCGTAAANSLAINLNLLTTQAGNMQGDLSLHRVADNTNIGTASNYNTMQTDIIMGYIPSGSSTTNYSGIYFDDKANPASSPYLTSGSNSNLSSTYRTNIESDVVAANATLVANSFLPLGTATVRQACATTDIGRIMKNGATPASNVPQSDVVCSNNATLCTTSNPCYLSISDAVPSRMRNNAATSNTFSAAASCPSGSVIDTSIPPVYGTITSPNTTNCKYTEIGPRSVSTSTASISVLTTWLLIYYSGTGTCATVNGVTTVGTGVITNSTAVTIAGAACTQ